VNGRRIVRILIERQEPEEEAEGADTEDVNAE
jgi:hypothetical protein